MGSLRSSGSSTAGEKAVVESVDADAACALLSTGQYGYVDVRMWEDFDKGHVAGARNVPYYLSVTPHGRPEKNDRFVDQVAALHGKDDRLIVGCRSGVRSRLAAADLVDAGFTNVKNLEGGYLSLLKSVNPHPTAYHQ
ncbi:thiosulfate sulfurtransferase 16, chloroplastic-like [Lolium rigidum]|uniref:thiosulfate sulfurtransferase 16, chloroplastic-like n=1 Tax=Lolium rigidum TaxID=89674 RepID=UPI001F5D0F06|nr:thiosulfate sulfurtransferase 16, chloroplastic-like [Lolium rigidum]